MSKTEDSTERQKERGTESNDLVTQYTILSVLNEIKERLLHIEEKLSLDGSTSNVSSQDQT